MIWCLQTSKLNCKHQTSSRDASLFWKKHRGEKQRGEELGGEGETTAFLHLGHHKSRHKKASPGQWQNNRTQNRPHCFFQKCCLYSLKGLMRGTHPQRRKVSVRALKWDEWINNPFQKWRLVYFPVPVSRGFLQPPASVAHVQSPDPQGFGPVQESRTSTGQH